MHAKNNGMLPAELARKISPWMVNSAEMAGSVGKSAFTGIAACLLSGYAPAWTGNADYNGLLLLLGPWVCPSLIAFLWSLRLAKLPFRIYRGSPFAEHSFVDTGDDPAVMRLAELCKSDEARRHVCHEALKLSSILFAILGTAAFLLRNSLNWAYPSPKNHFLFFSAEVRGVPGEHFWFGLFGCSLFMFLVLGSDHMRWCLMTWAKGESAHHVVPEPQKQPTRSGL